MAIYSFDWGDFKAIFFPTDIPDRFHMVPGLSGIVFDDFLWFLIVYVFFMDFMKMFGVKTGPI